MGQELHEINWKLLYQTVDYFTGLNFKYIEVPWLVPSEISKITFKNTDTISGLSTLKYGDLIGSSEQSFIYLSLYKNLPLGRYIAVSPCFREDEIDRLHQRHFMKAELFITDDTSFSSLYNVIDMCSRNFSTMLGEVVELVETEDGYDIVHNGIELGSYGVRTHNDLTWIYATALAEPRFSDLNK